MHLFRLQKSRQTAGLLRPIRMPRSEWNAVVHDGKNRRRRYRTWLECLTKVYRDFNQQKVVATADGSADNILKCPSSLA